MNKLLTCNGEHPQIRYIPNLRRDADYEYIPFSPVTFKSISRRLARAIMELSHESQDEMAIELKGLRVERLHELLEYNPETGEFRAKVDRWRVKAGTLVGGLTCKGYWQIGIDGKSYEAHRLAWLYVYGEFPASDIDHKNRNRSDNRIANLRQASPSQNLANSSRPPNKCGFQGVSREKTGRWAARIMVQYKQINVGTFDSPEEASAAYQAAKSRHFGEFAA